MRFHIKKEKEEEEEEDWRKRSLGSNPSHGSEIFAFAFVCYYMIDFIYECGKQG